MNLLRLSWKNITHRPLSMALSVILFALGVGLISLLLLLENQLAKNFEKNLAGIDLVIGAKGSPLQLILSSMYHIDAPTGNITLDEARPFLNPAHPLIETSIPLAMGDSYRGFRIVGSSTDILALYDAEIGTGEEWKYNFDVVLGNAVANSLEIGLNDEFKSSHGFLEDENLEHDHSTAFKVVGILEPNGTVLDQLILTTPQSYWLVHGEEESDSHENEDHEHDDQEPAGDPHDHEGHEDHEGHDHEDHDHEGQDHEGHDHEDHEDHDHEGDDHGSDPHDHSHDHSGAKTLPVPLMEADGEKAITAILAKFKGRNFQALNMQRNINENTGLQAATPAIEINRLYSLMNTGEQALRILAIVIIIVSGLSIFISLFASLRDRRYELALMRVMGAHRGKLFALIVLEGLVLSLVGFVVGMLLSHIAMHFFAGAMAEAYRYDFTGAMLLKEELYLLVGALLIGFLAAVLPAIQASKTDISETLSQG